MPAAHDKRELAQASDEVPLEANGVNDTQPQQHQPVIPSPVVGFSLATPNSGPEQAPSYVNFSPLFTSTPQQSHGIQQPIPINLAANGMMRSPRLEALAAIAKSSSSKPLSSIFSPPTLYAMPQPNAAEFPHPSIDDPQPVSSFSIPPQQHDLSIMERYQLYADEHRPDLDAETATKRRRLYEPQDDSSSQLWAIPAQKTYAEKYQKEMSQPAVILNKGSDENSSSFVTRMTPKTKVPVGAGGSSCHQCKNRREANQLNFCRNRIRSETNPKRKICRKKFCDHCLVKFRYSQVLPRGNKDITDWECPSCLGICVCAACKRKADPSLQLRPGMPNSGPQDYSVAMTFAHKLLADPNLMSQTYHSSTG